MASTTPSLVTDQTITCMEKGHNTFGCVVELGLVFSVLAFPLVNSGKAEEEDDGDDDTENLILDNSASRAGARVLTTVSMSDCFDRDWKARRTKMQKRKRLVLW